MIIMMTLAKISLYGGVNGSQTSAPFGLLLSFSPKKKKKLFPPGVSVGFWSTTHVNKNPLFLRVMSDGGNEIINR